MRIQWILTYTTTNNNTYQTSCNYCTAPSLVEDKEAEAIHPLAGGKVAETWPAATLVGAAPRAASSAPLAAFSILPTSLRALHAMRRFPSCISLVPFPRAQRRVGARLVMHFSTFLRGYGTLPC